MSRECAYCGANVSSEEYENHLRSDHREELSVIDRRRVGDARSGAGRTARTYATYAGIGAILLLFAVGYAILFVGFGADAPAAAIQPDPESPTHEHGTLVIERDGAAVDLSDSEYVERDDCFHFHAADGGEVWHTHCENVTVEYALATLGMDVSADSLVIDDETYGADDPNTTVSVTVDGEPVDPETYVLEGVGPVDDAAAGDGDNVRVVAETAD